MNTLAWLIILHQLLFQGMFFAKNFRLKRRLDGPIRGSNLEANLAIGLFVIFILVAIAQAILNGPPGPDAALPANLTQTAGLVLLLASLLIARSALKDLGDSWRVGVLQNQQTDLIERGIYRFSRNPFFVAYLTGFAGYGILLQSAVLLSLLLICLAATHAMILKEEGHLARSHGTAYQAYKQRVPRYLGW
ncbi:MAG: protein-S-isoprenylcysteine O-methyltransferase Ste14 [Bacteroidia bacterium]|jgi:protein-S-isoprenylcysteine O-methyltransferase Ste14